MADAPRKTILVTGDATIDWFHFPVEGNDDGENFRRYPAMHYDALPGGVFLLGECIKNCIQATGLNVDVLSPEPVNSVRRVSPAEIIHSNAALKPVGVKDGHQVLRIEHSLGFFGPSGSVPGVPKASPDPPVADIVVIDDVGNGFRNLRSAWPQVVQSPGDAIVVHKLAFSLQKGELWEHLNNSSNDLTGASSGQPTQVSENYVAVISAADLRRLEEVNISESLSWERTAKDFVFHIQRNPSLKRLEQCAFLVIHFGTDGAILYDRRAVDSSTLIFDTHSTEGQFQQNIDGTVFGLTSMLTATIVTELARNGISGLQQGIVRGLARARQFLEAGYHLKDGKLSPVDPAVFVTELETRDFTSISIPKAESLQNPDPRYWRILDQKTRNTRQVVAREIVKFGKAQGLAGVPVGCFGALETIDRSEIESYNAIRELIDEFLENPKPPRPLCFAVFGPPGSGKSYGVKQVIKSIRTSGEQIEVCTFNISQFHDYTDLVAALHQVRNLRLEGKVPFVFFDEFDSPLGDQALGWLKFFLAPMQDGEFKEGGAVHPIGSKAIFAFAGGTRSSFGEFECNLPDETNGPIQSSDTERAQALLEATSRFREAKGPDFVSRLRGFINVMGPNPQFPRDDAAIIRRAMVLHSLLKRNPKTDAMFDAGKNRIRIDEGVLRALLHVRIFLHGVRSIEALLDMSQLASQKRFNLSALPHEDQLELHVDAREFRFLAAKDRFQTMMTPADLDEGVEELMDKNPHYVEDSSIKEQPLIEEIGRRIHGRYKRHRDIEGDSVVEFDKLSLEKQKSNFDAAEDIPRKLRKIQHGIRRIPNGRVPQTPDIRDDEILKLAKLEHDRWCQEQAAQGFTWGSRRDPVKKKNPSLVRFEELDAATKTIDIEAVIAIPVILNELGYEVFRREEVAIIDPDLIDRLARALHADYVKHRTEKGETVETNSSLVEYDKLSEEMQGSNIDNARTIPRKLNTIGYSIRRLPPDTKPAPLEFTATEIETMAQMEHSRWNWFHYLRDWIYAPVKDEDKKHHNCLLPWNPFFEGGKCLSETYKDYDREPVCLIPKLLEDAGYEAYRL